MSEQRRHFHDPEKVAIPGAPGHLVDEVPISDLCDEYDPYPNQIYDWLTKFFENGHLAFAGDRKSKAVENAKDRKIEHLEAKLQRKDSVMAELMEEHTLLKKRTWGDLKGRWLAYDNRDRLVDFVRAWSDKTEIPVCRFLPWIGVGVNLDKQPFFSIEERVELLRAVTKPYPNVEVKPFNGLAVRFVRECGSSMMIRGLRTLSNMEYEFTMWLMNLNLDPRVETVFLMAKEEFSHVSSSLLRQIATLEGDLGKFLPPEVNEALRRRVKERYDLAR